jgi:hypothetical protein
VHLMYAVVRKGVEFNPRFGLLALDGQDGI